MFRAKKKKKKKKKPSLSPSPTPLRTHAPSSFPTDRSKAVPLLQFYVCVSVISYVVFLVALFVPRLSFLWCLGGAGAGAGWGRWGLYLVISTFLRYLYLYFNLIHVITSV